MIRMDGKIHVEGVEEGVTGDSAYAGSGVYPDQGGLPSRGRPSDFRMWRPRNIILGKQKREEKKVKKGIWDTAHSVAVRTTERARCKRRWRWSS